MIVESGLPDAEAWVEMLATLSGNIGRLQTVLRGVPEPVRYPAQGMGGRLLAELERERSRIARELHAGAGQPLAAIKLNLELLDDWAASMPENAKTTISRLRNLSDTALEQIRAVSHRLHPPEWQDLTTEDAIRHVVQQSGVADRFETSIEIGQLPVEPGHATKVALYRCAQECLSNVIRHSGATRVGVHLSSHGDFVELQIADNGKGIDSGINGDGIGLEAIREHIALLGGALDIDSAPGGTAIGGTTITVSFPLVED